MEGWLVNANHLFSSKELHEGDDDSHVHSLHEQHDRHQQAEKHCDSEEGDDQWGFELRPDYAHLAAQIIPPAGKRVRKKRRRGKPVHLSAPRIYNVIENRGN
nr:hypothetical protein Iba_chr14aCG4980 [Ipomoea batatas]